MPAATTAGGVVAVGLLSAAATLGGLATAVAGAALVLGALTLMVVGAQRVAVLTLMAAYFTAPFYKGVSIGAVITATDLLLLAGFLLLLPQLSRGSVRFPAVYVSGVAVVLVTGLLASSISANPAASFLALAFWMIVMAGLPVALALWMPGTRILDLLAASFVAGQCFSLVMGIARGNEGQGRQAGLSTHPNYLAQAGMLAICLLIYLVYRYAGRSVLLTGALVGAAALCAASVWMSGSRAGLVVVAVLVLMIPVVERSAPIGLVVGGGAAATLLLLPLLAALAGRDSPLARLTGQSNSGASDTARTLGLDDGMARFLDAPLTGSGLIDLFDIHNNFLEVLVGIGIFGLAGYLMVLYALARPLFGSGDLRRLNYAVWGYIGFGATVPSLYDRSVWAVVALGALAMALPAVSTATPASAGTPTGVTPDPTPAPPRGRALARPGSPAERLDQTPVLARRPPGRTSSGTDRSQR